MALQKQNVPVSFSQGVDTKTDPKQVQGKLLDLQNGIFQTGMEIRKRNGYSALPSLSSGLGISAYNDELVSLDGSSLFSYNANGSSQVNKGSLPALALSTKTVLRTTTQQTIQDSAINGTLKCFTWYDGVGQVGYSIFDTTTGQSIVNNATVDASGTHAKVLALGSNFVIIYYSSTGPALKYKSINISTPTVLSSAVTISTDINSTYKLFGATVFNSRIYLAFSSQANAVVSLYYLDSSLVLSSKQDVGATRPQTCLTIFGDASNQAWVAWGDGTNIKVTVRSANLSSQVLAPTTLEAIATATNITGTVSGTTATFYYQITGITTVTGDPNDYIKTNTLTAAGSAGAASVFIRGVGLASKVFVYSGVNYLLAGYQSNLQSGYFLLNGSAKVVLKVSPQVGGGYTTFPILPEVNTVSAGVFQTASLIKDLLTAASGSVYTQTGVISAQFSFTAVAPSKFVLGKNLHVGGGLVNMYDGGTVVEHGFNVFPEGLVTVLNSGAGGIGLGSSVAQINQFQHCAVYEWTDNQGQLHRSAPSIPITTQVPSNPVTKITGDTNSTRTGPGFPYHGTQIINVPSASLYDPSTSPTGIWYVNIVGHSNAGPGNPFLLWTYNGTIASASGTTINLNFTYATAPDTGVKFIISASPLGWYSGPGIYPTAGTGATAVGQVLVPADGTTSYPDGTYVTSVSPLTLSNIPNATSGTAVNYYSADSYSITVTVPTLKLTSKARVSIALYRTENLGTVFYRTSSPTALTYNDTTADSVTFTDVVADSTLVGNEQLYTTGGEVENIGVPAINVAQTFKSRAIVVPSENPLSWWYSKQVIPGSPVEFSDLFVNNIDSRIGAITAIGVVDDKLIFFGPSSIFYVVGDGPSPSGLNNTFTDAQLISSDVGCTNQASVVLTPNGVMFQSAKGIYLLDRSLAVSYIGSEVEAYNAQTVTSSQLMQSVNQVRFTMSGGKALVFDYFYKQWSTFTNHSAVDSCIYNSNFTFLGSNGTILTEAPGVYTDNGSSISLSLSSNWLSFANLQGFQRIYQFLLLGQWFSSHSLNATIYTDFSDTSVQSVDIPWTITPTIPYQMRIFLLQQKCESMKIVLTESGSSGQGLSISAVSFVAGLKAGLNKLPASQSYG